MEYASYAFKIENKVTVYGENTEIIVKASNFKEAEKLANTLLEGSAAKLGHLCKVVDARLLVNEQNITERKLSIQEHQMDVKHSGKITEVRVDGGSTLTKVKN